MTNQSDTPRTDAQRLWPACTDDSDTYSPDGMYVDADKMAELERELNAALARAEKAEANVDRLQEKHKRSRQVLEKIAEDARRIYGNTEDKDLEFFLEDLIYIISETTKP